MRKATYYPLALLALLGCSRGDAGPETNDATTLPTSTGQQAGVLTAGEWSDLRNWPYWQSLLKRWEWLPLPREWKIYPSQRYTVTLTTPAGQPLPDAHVLLSGATGTAEAVTDHRGQAELFPTLFEEYGTPATLPLQVRYRGQTLVADPLGADEHTAARTVAVAPAPATAVDIMFVVDATGSMGDEIDYLKAELRDVVARTQARVPAASLRLASVFYRDQGDAYLTRAQPFTTDINQLMSFVQAQQAEGGGDIPEAVDEALQVALQQQWSTEARCRLLFLVLDAPPHPEAVARLQALTRQAAAQGIRLIPVAASGTTVSTEYLLRALAVSTNGTYVFITNDSGVGHNHLTPTVGSYQVEYLNNLLVRLITERS